MAFIKDSNGNEIGGFSDLPEDMQKDFHADREITASQERRRSRRSKEKRVAAVVLAIIIGATAIPFAINSALNHIEKTRLAKKIEAVNENNANYYKNITHPSDRADSFERTPEQIQADFDALDNFSDAQEQFVTENGNIESTEAGNPEN